MTPTAGRSPALNLSPTLRWPRTGTEIVDWKAATAAGLAGGAVFLLLEMAAAWLVHSTSPWRPVAMMAGIMIGGEVVPPKGRWVLFNTGIFAAALCVHTVLSITYSFIDSSLFHRLRRGALAGGALAGLAIYIINFYGFTALFPWFIEARGWSSALIHMVFGVTCAATYRVLARAPSAKGS